MSLNLFDANAILYNPDYSTLNQYFSFALKLHFECLNLIVK